MLFGKGPYCLSGPNCQENLFRNDSNLAETPRINIRVLKGTLVTGILIQDFV